MPESGLLLSWTEIAIAFAAYLFAAFTKGITGLGFSTTCLPFLVLTVGLKSALPLIILPSLASNLLVMVDAGRFMEALRRFWPLVAMGVPGLIAGLWVLDRTDPLTAAACVGIVLVSYSLFAFARPELHLPVALERPLAPIAGLTTGFVNGLTGSQVLPMMPFLLALRLDPNLFVQASNIAFTTWSLVMAAGLSGLGLFTWEAVAVSAVGIAPVFAGVWLGNRVRRLLPVETFRRAVLVVLLLAGAGLLWRAFA